MTLLTTDCQLITICQITLQKKSSEQDIFHDNSNLKQKYELSTKKSGFLAYTRPVSARKTSKI